MKSHPGDQNFSRQETNSTCVSSQPCALYKHLTCISIISDNIQCTCKALLNEQMFEKGTFCSFLSRDIHTPSPRDKGFNNSDKRHNSINIISPLVLLNGQDNEKVHNNVSLLLP